jgi:dihydroorotase
MPKSHLLDPIQILYGAQKPLVNDAVLIIDGEIKAFGEEAREQGKQLGIKAQSSPAKLLAPCLVDPHSFLEEPVNSRCETLSSLKRKAACAGFGQIALLPRSKTWRDQSSRLQGFNNSNSNSDIRIHLWGGFSEGGNGSKLSIHSELLQNGAIGLADDDTMIPVDLLNRGLKLEEIGVSPILIAPRDLAIQEDGIVRECVEALRAGWAPDPVTSETIPLSQILQLHSQYPKTSLRLMNISTAKGVAMLENSKTKPMTSVCWWHLIKDTSSLSNNELGWRVVPSLGSPKDRTALIKGVKKRTITAIAVHSLPLDEEETILPPDKRLPGLSGYQLVLPLLWQELVVKLKWKIEELWEALSFGPSRMLNLNEESLNIGSKRWLIFDPEKVWVQNIDSQTNTYCANEPLHGEEIQGKVVDYGLKVEEVQSD